MLNSYYCQLGQNNQTKTDVAPWCCRWTDGRWGWMGLNRYLGGVKYRLRAPYFTEHFDASFIISPIGILQLSRFEDRHFDFFPLYTPGGLSLGPLSLHVPHMDEDKTRVICSQKAEQAKIWGAESSSLHFLSLLLSS